MLGFMLMVLVYVTFLLKYFFQGKQVKEIGGPSPQITCMETFVSLHAF